MILWKRIIPFLVALGVLASLQALIRTPQHFWFVASASLFVAAIGAALLVHNKARAAEALFITLVPVGLTAFAIALLLFVNETLIAQTVSVACSFLTYWYLENVFHFFYQPQAYQPYALENITAYCNILVAWFGFSSLSAARVFVNVSMFVLAPAAALFIVLLLLQLAWSAKVPLRENLPILLTEAMVMSELAAVVLLLPTSFYAAGLLLTVPYFLMVNVTRHHVRGTLAKPVVVRYAAIGMLTLVVTFATAPWT